jgi:hypothetical protein
MLIFFPFLCCSFLCHFNIFFLFLLFIYLFIFLSLFLIPCLGLCFFSFLQFCHLY